jgi:protein SCO1/2
MLRPIHIAALALLFGGSAAAVETGTGPTANQQPEILREVEIVQKLDSQVPLDAMFRDETGAVRPLASFFRGKPVVLALAYYECPMLCTLVLNGLTSALKTMSLTAGTEFDVVTVSFDPEEGPALAAAKKKNYLDRYRRLGAESGWHFLTGEAESINRLTEAVGFGYRYDPEIDEFAHAAAIMVLTPEGRVSRYFYGVEYPPRDLRLGIVEAGEGKIGTVVDQVLLYCYRYDPATGSYTPVIMNIMRLGGVLTVLGMGTLILVLRRREILARAKGTLPRGKTDKPNAAGGHHLATEASFAGAMKSGQSQ